MFRGVPNRVSQDWHNSFFEKLGFYSRAGDVQLKPYQI